MSLEDASLALQTGDKAQARRLLKPVLQATPTADAWVLAAKSMETEEQAITCLKRAIALDAWHNEANRLLLKLEKVQSVEERMRAAEAERRANGFIDPPTQPLPEIKRQRREMEYQKMARQRRQWRRAGCLLTLTLQMLCGVLSLGLVGAIPGAIGSVDKLLSGAEPVREVDGVPIEDIPDAPVVVPPSQSKDVNARQVDVLDHGFNHEYLFDAVAGEEVVGYVQFMSVNASAVADNVRILDPENTIVTNEVCEFLGEGGLLGGQGNVTFTCQINKTGEWKVRVLGVEGESIGAYFVGVEKLR
ncbi:MAG: hypothetical protein OHK0046_33190 [Anaerolineae bacterium]